MTPRIKRDAFFMAVAKSVADRGTCLKLKVGCVLVSADNRIVATGYNSSHRGSPHCEDIGCLEENKHCVRCLHAEEAAVLNLDIRHKELKVYVTALPCIHCYKILSGAGVRIIMYKHDYGVITPAYKTLINEIGVSIIHVGF